MKDGSSSSNANEDKHRQDSNEPNRNGVPVGLIMAAAVAVTVVRFYFFKRRSPNFARQANSTEHGGGYRKSYQYGSWSYGRGRDYEREGFAHRDKSSDSWFGKDGHSWEEHMEELERLERIRHMQETFHRRSRPGRSYETWQEHGGKEGQQGQYSGREDWYWGGEDWDKWRTERARARFGSATSKNPSAQAHHFDVLGLNSARKEPYSDAEIKAAFRAKAMEYHPDRNQHRKDHAESKFRELVASYEALKTHKSTDKSS